MQQQTFAEASFEPYRKPVRWIFRSVLRIVKPSILVTTRAAVLVLMTLISAGFMVRATGARGSHGHWPR
jgi:hypothetical protein